MDIVGTSSSPISKKRYAVFYSLRSALFWYFRTLLKRCDLLEFLFLTR